MTFAFRTPAGAVAFTLLLCAWPFAARDLAVAAEKPNLAFTASGNEFRFDTGALRGTLRKSGRSTGLMDVIDIPSSATISTSLGICSHYRLLDADARYGPAAWDWKSEAKLPPDGSVEARWSADKVHPFDLAVTYRFASPNTLDLTTTITAKKDLRKLESFLASYFAGFDQSFVYARDQGKSRFIPATLQSGVWQMFPRDDDAVKIIQDGRWKREPNPVDWIIRPRLAGALAMRRDAKTGLAALVMAPPQDCFAVATPHGPEPHRSLYLCLFGRDLKPGESVRARSRLIIARDIADARAVELYEAYLREAGVGR